MPFFSFSYLGFLLIRGYATSSLWSGQMMYFLETLETFLGAHFWWNDLGHLMHDYIFELSSEFSNFYKLKYYLCISHKNEEHIWTFKIFHQLFWNFYLFRHMKNDIIYGNFVYSILLNLIVERIIESSI